MIAGEQREPLTLGGYAAGWTDQFAVGDPFDAGTSQNERSA